MTRNAEPVEILSGLYLFVDTCNVYVIKEGDRAIAIDFGSGKWMDSLADLGIHHLDHVFLTHDHPDQCEGLLNRPEWPFTIHAASGYLLPHEVADFHSLPTLGVGCPASYSVLPKGIPNIIYNMYEFFDFFWGKRRICFIETPGHGRHSASVILEHAGKEVVFCGDAAYADAKIWQPYHLEWEHSRGIGAMAAWQGVMHLHELGMDILCPSHGPVIDKQPRQMLRRLAKRLMDFFIAKGCICAGEKDYNIETEAVLPGVRRYLPSLYQYGANGYLLVSKTGEGLVVDPYMPDMEALEALLNHLGGIKPTAQLCSHYHIDHCDGIPYLRQKYGTKAYLHPWVAAPIKDIQNTFAPYLPNDSILPDTLWPEVGKWQWNEYEFDVAPMPGQTWWHCGFMTTINFQRVCFGGDSFQPTSRWNGTGGYCAYNNSRFEGFIYSANLLLDWNPDIMAMGHAAAYYFKPSHARAIIKWAKKAEQATRALCPTGDLEQDYYIVHGNSNLYKASLNDVLPK